MAVCFLKSSNFVSFEIMMGFDAVFTVKICIVLKIIIGFVILINAFHNIMLSFIMKYLDELLNDRTKTYVFNFPLCWFLDDLPGYLRFAVSSIIVSFLIFKSLKRKERISSGVATQSNKCDGYCRNCLE